MHAEIDTCRYVHSVLLCSEVTLQAEDNSSKITLHVHRHLMLWAVGLAHMLVLSFPNFLDVLHRSMLTLACCEPCRFCSSSHPSGRPCSPSPQTPKRSSACPARCLCSSGCCTPHEAASAKPAISSGEVWEAFVTLHQVIGLFRV